MESNRDGRQVGAPLKVTQAEHARWELWQMASKMKDAAQSERVQAMSNHVVPARRRFRGSRNYLRSATRIRKPSRLVLSHPAIAASSRPRGRTVGFIATTGACWARTLSISLAVSFSLVANPGV